MYVPSRAPRSPTPKLSICTSRLVREKGKGNIICLDHGNARSVMNSTDRELGSLVEPNVDCHLASYVHMEVCLCMLGAVRRRAAAVMQKEAPFPTYLPTTDVLCTYTTLPHLACLAPPRFSCLWFAALTALARVCM